MDNRSLMPARFPIQRQDIRAVVEEFYARVRQDEILGPVFGAHVRDWPEHEEKITRFWANAILFERNYSGNPMQVHMNARDVLVEHFPRWLTLFDATLHDQLTSDLARQWSHLAHRIERGLSMGVEEHRRPADAVPNLLPGSSHNATG